MKNNFTRVDYMYMNMAILVSNYSYAERKKVGAIIVDKYHCLAEAYNGMPRGWDNNCEVDNITNTEVLHAESNLLSKLLIKGISSKNTTVYITLSPCIHCAKLLYQAGVSRIIYLEKYRDDSGLLFLDKCNILTQQMVMNNE